MRRLALLPLAITLLLFPPLASALGLGEIEMQSALNQRLDAEIPLRGVPEEGTDRIIVSLASEEAFRDVGLQRPFSLTRLRFEVKQRDSGGHFVHVTSREPIVEPFLSFLIEIDWPGGNLLREYTVLLDPPVFVSEQAEDEPAEGGEPAAASVGGEDAVPAAGVPSDIERGEDAAANADADADEPVAEEMAPAPEAPETGEEAMAAEPEPREGDFSDTPVFLQVEQDEERAEQEAAARARAEAETAETGTAAASGYDDAAGEYGPVGRGEALWNIASQVKRDDMTVQQMMLALLRYNPEAFADDNINRLKQGYVLRIPEAGDVLSLSAQQAVAQVSEQNALWQEFRRAARGGTGQARQAADGDAPAATAAGDEETGLEIVGSEEGSGASSDEVASATGGSAQPDQELKLAREQLESERMEKAELESRVEELEETVGKMERLIELRENQLAQLQEQLGQIEEGADPEDVVTDLEEIDTAEAVDDTAAAGDETATEEAGTATAEEDTDATAAGDTETADTATEEATEEAATEEATGETGTAEATTEQTGAETAPAADDEGGVTTVRTQPREPDMFDRVTGILDSVGATIGGLIAGIGLGSLVSGPLALPIAGGVGVLVLLGIILAVRRRRGGGDETEEAFAPDTGAMGGAAGEEGGEDLAGMFDEGDELSETDDSMLAGLAEADDSGLSGGDEGESDAEAELMSESFDLEGLEDEGDRTTAIAAESSDDDTIAEADVYLAYGLHQQAEELLGLAIEEQPERIDYRAKLLEAIYGDGRADDFVAQAETLRGKVEDDNPNWLRVVAMGQELAPDNELFQQQVDESLKPAGGSGATQPPETDFDLGDDDGDSTALDLSFDDDESGGGDDRGSDESGDDTFAQTMMLDSDEFEGQEGDAGLAGPDDSESDESSVSAAAGDDDDEMEFDLGDLDLGAEDSDAAGETSAAGEGDADGESDFDLGDLDIGGDEEAAEDSAAATGEEASEGGDEADFDLGDFDLGEGEDEGEGEAEPAATGESPEDSGEADFDPGELGLEEETEESGAEAGSAEAESPEDEDAADFDLGDLDLAGDEDEPGAEAESAATDSPEADDEADFDLSDFDLGDEASGDDEQEEGDTAEDALTLDDESGSGDIDLDSLAGGDDDSGETGTTDDDDSDAFDFDLGDEETSGDLESLGDADDSDSAAMDTDAPEASAGDSGDDGGIAPASDDDADLSLEDLAADLAEEDGGLTGPGDDAAGGEPGAADAGEAQVEAAPEADAGAAGDDDEYGTMLDLARAYIDMGDAESARSALEEVAESGTDEQQEEARSLLDGI